MKRVLLIAVTAVCITVVLLVRQREVGEEFSGVTLRYGFWGSDTEKAAMKKVCERFEERHPDIHIRMEPLPWGQYWLKMKTRASGSSHGVPDILRMTSIHGAEWYARGQLRDLTSFIERDRFEFDGFFRASVEAVTPFGFRG